MSSRDGTAHGKELGTGSSSSPYPPRSVEVEIRKRHRYQGQSVSFNQCKFCMKIAACPYEVKIGGSWRPVCGDCKADGGGRGE